MSNNTVILAVAKVLGLVVNMVLEKCEYTLHVHSSQTITDAFCDSLYAT